MTGRCCTSTAGPQSGRAPAPGQGGAHPSVLALLFFVVGVTYFVVDLTLESNSLAAAPPPPSSDNNIAATLMRDGDGHYYLLHP